MTPAAATGTDVVRAVGVWRLAQWPPECRRVLALSIGQDGDRLRPVTTTADQRARHDQLPSATGRSFGVGSGDRDYVTQDTLTGYSSYTTLLDSTRRATSAFEDLAKLL